MKFKALNSWLFALLYGVGFTVFAWLFYESLFYTFQTAAMWAVFIPGNITISRISSKVIVGYALLGILVWLASSILLASTVQNVLIRWNLLKPPVLVGVIFIFAFLAEAISGTIRRNYDSISKAAGGDELNKC